MLAMTYLALGGKKLVLITGHRRENFGDGFISMVTAMKDLSEKYPDVDFVYPMHLNPNVRNSIAEVFGKEVLEHNSTSPLGEGWGEAKNFFFIEPLQYLEFMYLMEKSTVVLKTLAASRKRLPAWASPCL